MYGVDPYSPRELLEHLRTRSKCVLQRVMSSAGRRPRLESSDWRIQRGPSQNRARHQQGDS